MTFGGKLSITKSNASNPSNSFRTWLNFRAGGHASCGVSWWAPDEYIRVLKVGSKFYQDELCSKYDIINDIRKKNHYVHDK